MRSPLEILKTYWGFSDFKPAQQEIIEAVLAKKDVLALLPTGGGKSLCFQIPALIQPGICIVISPLVALMEDQVKALQAKNIKAMALPGGIAYKELDSLLDNCIYGNYKFLYLSPERLQQELVQERIKQMPVNLIAVDEAHCISQWGHDFRPAYRNIIKLRQMLPLINVIGLTATATKPVVQDIIEQLDLKEVALIQKSFKRKNLAYLVREVEDKNYYMQQILKENNEPAIVYVRTRKASIEQEQILLKNGISATSFHGGLTAAEKSKRLSQWLTEEKRVMVATSAFGMGIDKPNVRSVIHINLPENLESYFQEAGRAGRDNAVSKSIILTNDSDLNQLKNQFLAALPDVDTVKLIYKKLNAYFGIAYGEGEAESFDLNFFKFCQKYGFNTLVAYNALLMLDRGSVLTLSERFQKKTRVQFTISGNQLQWYLEANPQFDAVVKATLRTYGGLFDIMTDINLQLISSKAGSPASEVIKLFQQLHHENILVFEHDLHDTRISFLVPREDDHTINRLAPYIKLQIKTKRTQIEQVDAYVKNNSVCKSVQLLRYFGENNSTPCGKCSVCASVSETLDKARMKEIYLEIIKLLEQREHSSRELVEKIPFLETHVLKVLQLLLEKDAVTLSPTNHYKLKHL